MNTQILKQLRATPEVFEVLCQSDEDELRIQRQLRRRFPDSVVRVACALHALRRRAVAKFCRADAMWFDRVGLEQATSEPVARHKTKRFSGHVWDLCCGIGGDAICLAEHCDVIAVDRSMERCLMTKWNGQAYDVAARINVVKADVCQLADRPGLVHIDPDRREALRRPRVSPPRRRVNSLEHYIPGLQFMNSLMSEFRGGALKLSPAADFAARFPDCEIELISWKGECKEATVWFGALAGPMPRRATVLPSGASLCGDPMVSRARVDVPDAFIYDPDPSVVRAGLVDVLANQLGLWRLDQAAEHLTSADSVESPFLRSYRVRAVVSNNERAIRNAVRDFDWHEIILKSRHVPIDAQALRRKLPRGRTGKGVLIFTRIGGKAHAVLAEEV